MPTFANAHGSVTAVFVLLHSLYASTKLSVVSSADDSGSGSAHVSNASAAAPNATDEFRAAGYARYMVDANDHYVAGYGSNGGHTTQSVYTPHDDHGYHDFQITSPGDVSAVTYPFITTPRPPYRHLPHPAIRVPITKFFMKRIRTTPEELSDVDYEDDDDDDGGDFVNEFVPLPAYHANGVPRWSTASAHRGHRPFTFPRKPPASAYGVTSSAAFSGTATGSGAGTGSGFGYGTGSAFPNYDYAGGADASNDRTAHHFGLPGGLGGHLHHKKKKSKLDLKKLGILALVKIGLAKLKAFGILKMIFFILLKFKLILVLIFVKWILFLKAIKLLKSLLLPFFLLSLLFFVPLLLLALAPLLPLLLLLLALLPVPTPGRDKLARISLLHHLRTERMDAAMKFLGQFLESEECVERIACQLATRKESKLFYPIIKWYLKQISRLTKTSRIGSYVEAYSEASLNYNGNHTDVDSRQWCHSRYLCENSKSPQTESASFSNSTEKI